jgi:hypothetical protein
MKKVVFILFLLPALISCESTDKKSAGATAASEENKTVEKTTIEWIDSTTQNLPKVTEGPVVEITYRFKNTGTKPLVIEKVVPGCGCTVPEMPTKPIQPGETDVIKAKFNTQGRQGMQNKDITVTTNTDPAQHTLYFNVEVAHK